MIIVQDTFVCKPGNASKVAKLFKETMGNEPNTLYVMTDLSGQYHRVIMVSQYESLTAFDKMMEEMINPSKETQEEMKEKMKKMEGFRDMYISGSREIFRVW